MPRLVAQYAPVSELELIPLPLAGEYELLISYEPIQLVLNHRDQLWGLTELSMYPLIPSWSGMIIDIPDYGTGLTLS